MIFCNPVPIAYAAYVDKKVVADTHRALFKAMRDLTSQGRSLELRFNFAVISVVNRNMTVTFNPTFANRVNDKNYEFRMRKSDDTCKQLSTTTHGKRWKSSIMSTLMNRP